MAPNLGGKTIFITGGSSGLGREVARKTVALGAHVTLFARRQDRLNSVKAELVLLRPSPGQDINAVSVDLSDPVKVMAAFKSQNCLPDILYCVAGGCPSECGFIVDINPADLESCMRNNYFTSAYSAQSILKLWLEDDKKVKSATDREAGSNIPVNHRKIVFVNTAGALLGLPGYGAYTPSKTAVRALADTLRMEALQYSGPTSTYSVQCAFPSNFISEAFIEEQNHKPLLTKEIEGTNKEISELKDKLPSAGKVAAYIVAAADSADFALCDSTEAGLLWANMIGPSPKRGLGIIDSILTILVSLVMWPILRRQWDAMCKKAGKNRG